MGKCMGNEKTDIRRINILGITLKDCSLKEALNRTEEYINSGALNTMLYVTAPLLILAGKNEREKEWIEAADLTICGDPDILRVAKIESRSRVYEVENLVFLKEFLRRLTRARQTVYLLADTPENAENLRKRLEALQRGILIAGSRIVGEEDDTEETANRINDVAPAAVISRTAPGKQEEWMNALKPFVNAEVWLGIPEDMKLGEHREPIRRRIANIIYRKIFHTRINRYSGENEKNR